MESKFLDQDVDVVSLTNKGIVIGCFVCRNYNKILMETGKLTDNIRVTKNGLGSGVDRMFQSSDSQVSRDVRFSKPRKQDGASSGDCFQIRTYASPKEGHDQM